MPQQESARGRGLLEITGAVQHQSWLQKALPPVEQLGAGLWSIPVPIPNNPLRYVSVYVLAGDSSVTLIDCGWQSDESWAALCEGLAAIGASIHDVSGCLITHQHLDHIGLAGRVRSVSGAWIALHPADRDVLMRRDFRDPSIAMPAEVQWLIALGAPSNEASRLCADKAAFAWRETIAEPERLIEDGDAVSLPGWSLHAVHTPGHTPGHLCFIDEKARRLFSGDHILPRISPNISIYKHGDDDALGHYLGSLSKVTQHGVDEILPAHEWRFRGLGERVRQLNDHHQRRLEEILEILRAEPHGAPWEIAGRLTWSRPWNEYDGYMRISAVMETAAHLVHLCKSGYAAASDGPTRRYSAVI